MALGPQAQLGQTEGIGLPDPAQNHHPRKFVIDETLVRCLHRRPQTGQARRPRGCSHDLEPRLACEQKTVKPRCSRVSVSIDQNRSSYPVGGQNHPVGLGQGGAPRRDLGVVVRQVVALKAYLLGPDPTQVFVPMLPGDNILVANDRLQPGGRCRKGMGINKGPEIRDAPRRRQTQNRRPDASS